MRQRTEVIGLTGGTGSGKSAVSALLRQMGACVLDADQIGHEVIRKGQPAYREIVDAFGREILDSDGEIVRRVLGQMVFSDPQKLACLNQCSHTYIRREMERRIAAQQAAQAAAVVLDAPLLSEAGLLEICHQVWVVDAAPEVRLSRIMARDGLTLDQAQARISAQKSDQDYVSMADRVIFNNGSLEELSAAVRKLWREVQEGHKGFAT